MSKVETSAGAGERGPAPESMLDAALSYARRGWRVFPVHEPVKGGCSCEAVQCAAGKHPRVLGGLKAGTTDMRQIERWWERWPDANIGICTGPASGLLVLDVDGAVGKASLETLGASRRVPMTMTAKTGRKEASGARLGSHLYLRYPVGSIVRNSAGKIGSGLDVRGMNGYVVAPPSLHASGMRYAWRDEKTALADTPDWLTQSLAEPSPVVAYPGGMGFWLEGVRNDRLFRHACSRRRKGDTEQAILQHLIEQNAVRCLDPLSADELVRIAASAAKYPVGGPDPLEVAWAKVRAGQHGSLEARLWELAKHLQQMRGNLPIALPQVRIAELMRCDPTLVSRYRKRLVKSGRLIPVAEYIAKRMAGLYRVV